MQTAMETLFFHIAQTLWSTPDAGTAGKDEDDRKWWEDMSLACSLITYRVDKLIYVGF